MNRWRAEYDDGIWRFYQDGIELGLYEKGDVVVDALNVAESRIEELGLELGRKSVELGELVGRNILWEVINDELKSRRENLERENDRLQEKVSVLEATIEELIVAGNALDVPPDDFSEEQKEWRELVKDWEGA